VFKMGSKILKSCGVGFKSRISVVLAPILKRMLSVYRLQTVHKLLKLKLGAFQYKPRGSFFCFSFYIFFLRIVFLVFNSYR